MKFLIINAEVQTVEEVDLPDVHDAVRKAGLDPMRTDHGSLGAGFHLIVYEFGMLEAGAHIQAHFVLGSNLYAGNAAIYFADREGETRDVPEDGKARIEEVLEFLASREEVERAILAGKVERPQTSIITYDRKGGAQNQIIGKWTIEKGITNE